MTQSAVFHTVWEAQNKSKNSVKTFDKMSFPFNIEVLNPAGELGIALAFIKFS